MSAMPLAWHKIRQVQAERYLLVCEAELRRVQNNYDIQYRAVTLHRVQIEEAERIGVTSFDPEWLMKPETLETV
jgi:hypothetical protein